MIPFRLGRGQGLLYFALVARAADPVVPFYPSHVDLCVTQQGGDKARFAIRLIGNIFSSVRKGLLTLTTLKFCLHEQINSDYAYRG